MSVGAFQWCPIPIEGVGRHPCTVGPMSEGGGYTQWSNISWVMTIQDPIPCEQMTDRHY